MKVSAARPAQVRGIVVGGAVVGGVVEVDGAAVVGVLEVVPEAGDEVEVDTEDPAGVPGLDVEVTTLAVDPHAHSKMITPTVAMRTRRPWPDVEGVG
jgi:hypothetical protein